MPSLILAVAVCVAASVAAADPELPSLDQAFSPIITTDELRALPSDVQDRLRPLLAHGDRFEKAIRQIVAYHAGPVDYTSCDGGAPTATAAPGV